MEERRVERTRVTEPPADGYVDERRERVVRPPDQQGVTSTSYPSNAQAPAAAAADEVHATAYDPYANRRRASYKLVQAVWLLFGIVEGILAIRFILKLLGANEAAGFASFIYSVSAPFVAPFNNLFANPGTGGSVLELTTLMAIIVYMLVAWLVVRVIWLLAGETRSATRTVAGSTRARLD